MQTDSPSVFKKSFIFQRNLREGLVKMMRCRKSSLRSFLIDQELLEDQELRRRNRGSGRSTMVKQLRIHYGDSFPTPVRKFLIPFITANLADAVVRVVKIMEDLGDGIADPYVQELTIQLIRNRPSEGYTAAISFDFYNQSLPMGTTARNSSVETKAIHSIIEDERIRQNTPRMSALLNTSGQTNLQPSIPPTSTTDTPLHIKLSKSLTVKEIQSLLGSLHPEVDWAEVIQTEVFNKAPVGANQKEVLAAWLENAFKTGKLHPAKVMAALQERVRNPHIRKLPANIAAQLPPPNETPPTPPSTSAPDLDSNILTDTDDWSSNTSFQSEKKSLSEDDAGLHMDAPTEEKLAFEDREVKPRPSLTNVLVDKKESLVQNFQDFNVVSLSGRMLKLIIDRPEFQAVLAKETKIHLELSTSQIYFINNVDRFIQNDYVPTLRDILLVQMPCNAVRESLLQIGSTSLRLVNVGDQRGDRRKWISLFETVHAVLFFASLIDFLERSQLPEFKTKLDESLEYFWFIMESLPLSRKDSVLFLTKKDILPVLQSNEKITVASNYPELQEFKDPETCIATQRNLYLSKHKERGQKTGRVFIHSVCLLDIDEMKAKSRSALKGVLDSNFRRHAMF
ncbi:Guanine nucleotide-binding protein alpha-15 subunit [Echinococcus granulosus]|uniref:Guanine nucleotide binding protein subunit n=1 Tax=Echinococcus granulosus TaxID=6210 RepID=A0A068WYA1_ECHGR|nr:Guanine nucleotide-binding protein alpha-15 subunit [Echinococcus granulosus]CDS22660.1 guanine nucleotide binding protein subunit [Echinococcus granulosus]